MKKICVSLFFIFAVSSLAGAGNGINAGKLGVNFQYSGNLDNTLGAWYHITSMFAVAPYLGYSTKTEKQTSGAERTTNTFSFGLEAPIYLLNFNKINLFVAPGLGFSSQNENTFAGTDVSTTGLRISAALGLQYAFSDQFHVFGKSGLEYSSGKVDPGNETTTLNTMRSSIGAIFYFN